MTIEPMPVNAQENRGAEGNSFAGRSTEQVNLKQEETFQWTKQWYPVAVVKFLDPSRPHGIQLLGKELVISCCGLFISWNSY